MWQKRLGSAELLAESPMNIERIASRIATDLALTAGCSPRAILLEHYMYMGRRSKTASQKSVYRDASRHIALFGLGFFKDVAREMGIGLGALVDFFKDSMVVRFFQKVGWSFKKLYDLLKTGYESLKKLQKAFLEYAKETGVGKWTMKNLDAPSLRNIDAWLSKHPLTRQISGYALAGIFVYMWFQASYVGINPAFDFDSSEIFDALGGNYSLTDLFTGASGIAWLTAFLAGVFIGISFPWPGAVGIHFAASIIFTLAKRLRKKIKQSVESEEGELDEDEIDVRALPSPT